LEALTTYLTQVFIMKCPRCSRDVPDHSVYCLYCGVGIQPSARTTRVSVAGALLIVASVASLIFLIQSVRALAQIYTWYPRSVAEDWIIYDQMLTVFSLTGFLSGFSSGLFSLSRRSYKWTMIGALSCTLSGGGAWLLSIIIPYSYAWYSFLFYFLPVLLTALTGTLLIYPRKAEFR
jgi:hypothetical protein